MQIWKWRQPGFHFVTDLPGAGPDQSVQQLESPTTCDVQSVLFLHVVAREITQREIMMANIAAARRPLFP
jgi:hypothetical protein